MAGIIKVGGSGNILYGGTGKPSILCAPITIGANCGKCATSTTPKQFLVSATANVIANGCYPITFGNVFSGVGFGADCIVTQTSDSSHCVWAGSVGAGGTVSTYDNLDCTGALRGTLTVTTANYTVGVFGGPPNTNWIIRIALAGTVTGFPEFPGISRTEFLLPTGRDCTEGLLHQDSEDGGFGISAVAIPI